jgi:molecular chaperone DnaK (HSP70)
VILSGGTSHTPRIASNVSALFPPTTKVLSPSTSPTAINPSDLSARGAAIQASLIQEFDLEDISQSAHPMVTVTPHLQKAIGVLVLSDTLERGIFRPILAADTAAPARRTLVFATPKEGGDVLVKICEGERGIKVTTTARKGAKNGTAESSSDGDGSGEDDDDDDDDEEEVREKVWSVGAVLAEAAVRGVRKGGRVEVVVNVSGDLAVQVTAREVGGKGGVRGVLGKAGG